MRHIKLFESLDTKKDAILDVFQDIGDAYHVMIECDKEVEIKIVFDRHFKNSSNGKSYNTFYAHAFENYLPEDDMSGFSWVGEDGILCDYFNCGSDLFNAVSRGEYAQLEIRPYYIVYITANQKYVSDNFDGILREMRIGIHRLNRIHGMCVKHNKAEFYKNGGYLNLDSCGFGENEFIECDWENENRNIFKTPDLSSDKECSIHLYFH